MPKRKTMAFAIDTNSKKILLVPNIGQKIGKELTST